MFHDFKVPGRSFQILDAASEKALAAHVQLTLLMTAHYCRCGLPVCEGVSPVERGQVPGSLSEVWRAHLAVGVTEEGSRGLPRGGRQWLCLPPSLPTHLG